LPISAVDVVRVAFDHTATQLFKPFRLGQWTRLAVVAFLAGELAPNGCSFQSSFPSRRGGASPAFLAQALPFNPLTLLGIGLLVLVFFLLAIGFLYLSSRMRFVLFDSIVAKRCHILIGEIATARDCNIFSFSCSWERSCSPVLRLSSERH
jgi:hypothetical protein